MKTLVSKHQEYRNHHVYTLVRGEWVNLDKDLQLYVAVHTQETDHPTYGPVYRITKRSSRETLKPDSADALESAIDIIDKREDENARIRGELRSAYLDTKLSRFK